MLLRVLSLCRNLLNKYRVAETQWSTAELDNLLQAVTTCKEHTEDSDVAELAITCTNLVLAIAMLGNTAGN